MQTITLGCYENLRRAYLSGVLSSRQHIVTSALMTSRAWIAERFGRNPKLAGSKSASKIGSKTIFAAVIATRSGPLVSTGVSTACPPGPQALGWQPVASARCIQIMRANEPYENSLARVVRQRRVPCVRLGRREPARVPLDL